MAQELKVWKAVEAKGGWRLKIKVGPRTYKLKGLLIKKTEDVMVITGGNVVWAHLKNSKYPKKA